MFQTWSQFYPVFVEYQSYHLPHYFVENSQRVNKAVPKNSKVFVLSCSRQFFDHHDISQWSKHHSKKAYVGVDNSSQYPSFFVKPPTRSPPSKYHNNKQDGSLTESVNMTVVDWGVTHVQPPKASHRTWSKAGSRRTNLRQAIMAYFFCTKSNSLYGLPKLVYQIRED